MYNWSTDVTELKKNKRRYAVWRIEQLLNYGLGGEKLDKDQVRKYWPRLRLDPAMKKYIAFLLWPHRSKS